MSVEKEIKKEVEKPTFKKYTATQTIKITCNDVFQLVKGEEIPSGIDKSFIQSLKNSNLIN